jgi:N6-L-threonylcarbamoyladenine synthase
MGLPYPGGPLIDELAKKGNPNAYKFPHPYVERLNFSFSGLKTSMLYFIRDNMKNDSLFVEKNKADICASLQRTIIEVLIDKLQLAAMQHGIKEIAIAGGVSANSGLRSALSAMKEKEGWNVYIPDFEFCTDNAAMIAIAGYYKYLVKDFADQSVTPLARMEF